MLFFFLVWYLRQINEKRLLVKWKGYEVGAFLFLPYNYCGIDFSFILLII